MPKEYLDPFMEALAAGEDPKRLAEAAGITYGYFMRLRRERYPDLRYKARQRGNMDALIAYNHTRRTWTPEQVEGWYARRLAGDTLEAIGKEVGLTRERVRQVLLKRGYEVVRSDPRGMPDRPCKVCPGTYRYGEYKEHCQAAGHPAHYGYVAGGRRWDDYICERYGAGDRIADISRVTGKTYFGIYRILRRNGIEPSRGGGRYPRTAACLARRRATNARIAAGGEPNPKGWRG
jgi:hypothetical protein